MSKHWVGRIDEVKQLEIWLADTKVNLIGIQGLGGIGKSALAAFLYENYPRLTSPPKGLLQGEGSKSNIPCQISILQSEGIKNKIPSQTPILQGEGSKSNIPCQIPILQPEESNNNIPSQIPILQTEESNNQIPSKTPILQKAWKNQHNTRHHPGKASAVSTTNLLVSLTRDEN